ncbi:heat shock 70 kDa protein 14-like [Homalodisca vitripennis]|uniref:heat shock 70 kDa protein 14-like n=1 Tax=Homalodisca vitripennis TaxID=197043 RepID=UPI001EECECAE|nr:heat shock 70 kDa protein 14-like [Homalodisca vitripennis]
MKPVFGIHIGNTNASMAICKDNDHPDIVANDSGERLTPVNITVTDNEILVGAAAKSAALHDKTTISSNKTVMNMNVNLIKKLQDHKKINITVINDEVYYCLTVGGKLKYITPTEIATQILKKLYQIARNTLNSNEEKISCVLLAPAHSCEEFCENYRTSAENAGWTVIQIVNEPAAAVLSYSLLDTNKPLQTILVYRLGGTTYEVAAYEMINGMLFLLNSEHSEEIGGFHFTNTLFEYFADEFLKKHKLNVKENRRALNKLYLAAETCVHNLSKMWTANCYIESLQEGVDFMATVSRPQFELIIQSILSELTEPIKHVLNKLELERPVDIIILCGGATNIPKLQSSITNLFDPEVTQVLTCPNLDEVLALGAAKQAYYLDHYKVTTFLPRSQEIHF